MQSKEITVVGLGYIGLPTAVVMAGAGHHVKGFDAKKEVCESLCGGRIHIVENHLQEAFTEVRENGCLEITDEISASDIYVVCVPTPFQEEENEKVADLSYVESAAKEVAKVLKKGDLVILESTVPPHTTAMMTKILAEESGLEKSDFYTAHCPERVLPGRILYELKHNDRIIGAEDPKAAQITKELYETFVVEGHCYVCDDVTAELCKLAENTFRDINIAYANQLSMLCEKAGIDVFRLIELANKHPRVSILTPGLGVGGHCLAVDPWFIVEKYGEDATLIRTAREINEKKPLWVKDQVLKGIGNMHGLPAESHSSNAYIQLHPDGTFKMYREFNEKHLLIKEIAYHPEPKLSGHRNPVLHIHEYRQGSFQNRTSRLLTRSEYEKYKKYFKGVSEK